MPELYKNVTTSLGKSKASWRKWLEKHHASEEKVWLIMFKKNSGIPSLSWEEAVEEAICFGWIDSVRNSRDTDSFYQYFAKRKPKSGWSDINKNKVEKLTAEGKMAPAGIATVELAKKNGTWDALNSIEELTEPADLVKALKKNKSAHKHWNAFPRSTKKLFLSWILDAKQPATRKRRIEQTIANVALNIRNTQSRQPT